MPVLLPRGGLFSVPEAPISKSAKIVWPNADGPRTTRWQVRYRDDFDLLELDGLDLRRRPLEKRRTPLAALVDRHARGEPDQTLLFSVAFAEDGAYVFAGACALRCEGIVSERVRSIYHSGDSAGD